MADTPFLLVGLHSGTGLISRLIRWQTRSVYSHVSLIRASDFLLSEALEGRGVIQQRVLDIAPRETTALLAPRDIVDTRTVKLCRIKNATREQEEAIWAWSTAQIGKGYDYVSVARFITRKEESRRSSNRFFCSEKAHAAAWWGAGILLQVMPSWRCSPDHIAISPLLEEYHV